MEKYKNLESFNEFVKNKSINENAYIDIKIGEFETDKKAEESAAKNFSWIPPTKPITVLKCVANIENDYNTDIEIEMSNGDKIQYILSEQRKPTKQTKIPPFYTFVLTINKQIVSEDLDEILGRTGTIIGNILLFYRGWLEKSLF